ncbi:MAG: hypothetical protein PHE79_02755 [Eubacteriales bacterium]|nr:hypothetical protein [Eubacteriales bacterium]
MIQEIHGQRHGMPCTIKSVHQPETKISEKVSSANQSPKTDTIKIGAEQETFITYKKPTGSKPDAAQIASLKAEAEKATENLRKLVEELILKQNKNYRASTGDSADKLSIKPNISAADIEAAQKAISEEGEFGVKAVSDRLVDFAISISGGDKSKLSELVSSIDKGFAAAKQALGGTLPGICQQTYDETMRTLSEWANGTES